jgi:hypothetical protein
MKNTLYRRLEFALYGIVFAVSVGVGAVTERLDYRLWHQAIAAEIDNVNQSYAYGLKAGITHLVASANGLAAAVILKPEMTDEEFSSVASRLGTDETVVLNIALATDGVVQNVFPIGRNAFLLGTDLKTVPSQQEGVEQALESQQPVFLGPLDLLQGGRGFILRLAFAPTMAGTSSVDQRKLISIAVDATPFLEKYTEGAANPEITTVITHAENGALIYGDPSRLAEQPIVREMATPTEVWQIASAPVTGWLMFSPNAPAIAGLALLRFLIVCGVLWAIFGLVRKQKAAEEQLSDAIEALDDGFALFDAEDKLKLSNRRYRELYGTSSDILFPGASFEEILRSGVERKQYPDAIGQEEDWINRRLEAHRQGGCVLEQKLDNGTWLRVVERKTKDGGTVGFRVDITELKAAISAAKAAERAKSEFISVLSHELRTPLTVIMGYVSLLLEVGKSPAAKDLQAAIEAQSVTDGQKRLDGLVSYVVDLASRAHRSNLQLRSLINHLLDFSKIEAGKMRLDIADCDVGEILENISHAFRDIAEKKGLDFTVSGVASTVHADPIRLTQILMNLVGNAMKFTEAGSVALRASLQADMVLFEVEDTGCGVPAGFEDRIFGHFEQADDSYIRRAGGTGLGLAISRKLAELMGGKIGVRSRNGSGSVFWFTVPLSGREGMRRNIASDAAIAEDPRFRIS